MIRGERGESASWDTWHRSTFRRFGKDRGQKQERGVFQGFERGLRNQSREWGARGRW